MASNERLGWRVREFRTAKAVSQEELAEAAGLSRDAVARIERGDREPKAYTLFALAEALGCTVDALFATGKVRVAPRDKAKERLKRVERLLDQVSDEMAERIVRAIAVLCADSGAKTRTSSARLS